MNKLKPQIAIGTIGLISTAIGIWTMLKIPTMILTPLFLVEFYLPIAFIVSLVVGFFTKALLKSSWHTLTFAALIMTFICLTFSAGQYKSSYEIIIPDKYVGEVRLLVSNEKENDFQVNNYGIGYISQATYKNGFQPIIIENGKDISKKITGYSFGSYSSNNLSVDYVSFQITEKNDSTTEYNNLDSLVKYNAIDTRRLSKK